MVGIGDGIFDEGVFRVALLPGLVAIVPEREMHSCIGHWDLERGAIGRGIILIGLGKMQPTAAVKSKWRTRLLVLEHHS